MRVKETASSGVEASEPGVDVDVVLSKPRHAGDDALHLLVSRVGGDEGILGFAEDLLDFLAVLGEQPVVVEVDRFGQFVVLVGEPLQLFGLLDQFGRVVGQVGP